MSQLTLQLPAPIRAEASRRGLDVDDTITDRDRIVVGVVGGALAHVRRALEEAAEAGFTVTISVHYQDLGDRPKRAVLIGRISRLAVAAEV